MSDTVTSITSVRPRLGTVLSGMVARGTGIGAASGALFGTCVFPGLGTIYGLIAGTFGGMLGGLVLGLFLGLMTWPVEDERRLLRDPRLPAAGFIFILLLLTGAAALAAGNTGALLLLLVGPAATLGAMWAAQATMSDCLTRQQKESSLFGWTMLASLAPLPAWLISHLGAF